MDDGATVPLVLREARAAGADPERRPERRVLRDSAKTRISTTRSRRSWRTKFAQEIEVIKRDDRLETIAKDIVYHFPRRGYLGKGMVVSLDKFTAVKMYDKVQRLWKEEIKELRGQIKTRRATRSRRDG